MVMAKISDMECHRTAGLLPWLLNGTLPPEERRQVEDHLAACEPCRAELAETASAWSLLACHPTPRQLVAYALGETPAGEDRSRLRRPVDSCAACRQEVGLVAPEGVRPQEGAVVLHRRLAALAVASCWWWRAGSGPASIRWRRHSSERRPPSCRRPAIM